MQWMKFNLELAFDSSREQISQISWKYLQEMDVGVMWDEMVG
jgi:hypothetical protein